MIGQELQIKEERILGKMHTKKQGIRTSGKTTHREE